MHQHHTWKFHVAVVLVFILTVAMFAFGYTRTNQPTLEDPIFGITYSWTYAEQLGLDPIQTYEDLVQELGVQHVRLPIYWSEIEHDEDVFNWEIPDKLMQISFENDVYLTPVVGAKVPRWPECYIPDWAEKLNETYQQEATMAFIEATVTRYNSYANVVRWQVENEPFFPFGECPEPNAAFFKGRVDLTRQLTNKPIQVTVSGELGPWQDAAQAADILGISMYRQTHNEVFGHFVYPLSPSYYYFRTELVKQDVEKVIVSELQAEPWFSEPIESRPITDWYEDFSQEMFENNIQFVREANISEAYVWGAEWWYVLHQAGEDRLWNTAKQLFSYENDI